MRLFIAVTFPEPILGSLNERLEKLKPRLPRASWVRCESQHLTFAFLGEQDETAVARIAGELEPRMQKTKVFGAALHGCGFFPNRRHARVGWCGVDPPEPFCAIADSVREGVRAAGIAFDENEFRPHLTLMRLRDHWPPLAIETFEKTLRDYQSAPFVVDCVALYVSKLDPKGAVHTSLRKFSLSPRA
jgi:RNA 2',3'-cyclic 3'-phosphodiesterase